MLNGPQPETPVGSRARLVSSGVASTAAEQPSTLLVKGGEEAELSAQKSRPKWMMLVWFTAMLALAAGAGAATAWCLR